MFESLKSTLGVMFPPIENAGPMTKVDAATHQMLQDLNLPDPTEAELAQPVADQRDPLKEAREVVSDWIDEGYDAEQPLPVVFEALFDTDAQAQAYLFAARDLQIEGARDPATRRFGDSIAATVAVDMIAAPEELVRIEQALGLAAKQAGGVVDGYYLEGHADG